MLITDAYNEYPENNRSENNRIFKIQKIFKQQVKRTPNVEIQRIVSRREKQMISLSGKLRPVIMFSGRFKNFRSGYFIF